MYMYKCMSSRECINMYMYMYIYNMHMYMSSRACTFRTCMYMWSETSNKRYIYSTIIGMGGGGG